MFSGTTVALHNHIAMSRMTDEEKKVLASEILSYLLNNPDAGDTLEGIARFWTSRQRIDLMVGDVQDALGGLIAEGVVKERLLRAPDGSISQRYYQLDPSHKKGTEEKTATRKPGMPEVKAPGQSGRDE
jgi:hypothetical protein